MSLAGEVFISSGVNQLERFPRDEGLDKISRNQTPMCGNKRTPQQGNTTTAGAPYIAPLVHAVCGPPVLEEILRYQLTFFSAHCFQYSVNFSGLRLKSKKFGHHCSELVIRAKPTTALNLVSISPSSSASLSAGRAATA
jgi:hypothetical protein